VAIHGCGGVGLSAVMIAAARGARVIAVDLAEPSLAMATSVGAEQVVDASTENVARAILEITDGGAAVSVDALGSPTIVRNSLRCLRRRGRHIQVGLLGGKEAFPTVAMNLVIASELQILGSHGMAARTYPTMMADIASGSLCPERLIRDRISLDEVPGRLAALGEPGAGTGGITIIQPSRGTLLP
jgi:alcohol dehydrogenase